MKNAFLATIERELMGDDFGLYTMRRSAWALTSEPGDRHPQADRSAA
jgi:hypothetical protein